MSRDNYIEQQILTPDDIHQNEKNEVVYTRYDNILIDCGRSLFSTSELCYQAFKANSMSAGGKKGGCRVNGEILMPYVRACNSLLKTISEKKARENTNVTIAGYLNCVFSVLRELKLQGRELPENLDDSRKLLSEYLARWHEDIKIYEQGNSETGTERKGKSPNSLVTEQDSLIALLVKHSNISQAELTQGMKLVKRKRSANTPTKPIAIEELSQQFNYFTLMFRTLSNVVLNDIPLPQSVTLFDPASESPYIIHIAPAGKPICLEQESIRDHFNGKHVYWFNFDTGQYYLPSVAIQNGWTEMVSKYEISSMIKHKCKIANEPFSSCRIKLIKLALDCYFMHFMILTGLNDSVAATIQYSDSYQKSKSNTIGYTAIKYRAGHAEKEFELQTEFVADFELFIKLRSYLINHEVEVGNQVKDHLLFIQYSRSKINNPTVIPFPNNGTATSHVLRKNKKNFPSGFSASRVFRTTKGRWVRKKYGTEVAAYLLDHSTSTAMENYTENDAVQTEDEFTEYFSQLNEVVLSINTQDTQVVEKTAMGGCTSSNSPDFIENTPDELKKCNSEGCLFCRNYRLCATETDIRKLLSLQFIIEETRLLAKNADHFEQVFKLPLHRINELFSELNKLLPETKEMVEQVRHEVFDKEKLSLYWHRKFNQMIELGIL